MGKTKASAQIVAGAVVGSLAQLIVARGYLHVLGAEQFGLVLYLLSVSIFGLAADIGYSRSALRELTLLLVDNDEEGLRLHIGTLMTLTVAAALLCVAGIFVAGFFLTLPVPNVSTSERAVLFSLAGFNGAFVILQTALAQTLGSAERFAEQAMSNLLKNLGSATLGILFVFAFRTPESVLLGSAIGSGTALVYTVIRLRIAYGKGFRWFAYHKPTAQKYTHYALRYYPQRLTFILQGSLDRLLLAPALGGAALTWYQVSARLPQTLGDNLMLTCSSTYPEMVRQSTEAPEQFSRSAQRNAALMATLGTAIVILPCLFAPGLLKLILGVVPPNCQEIALVLGLAKALDLIADSFNLAFAANDRPERGSLMLIVRVIIIAAVTLPVAHRFGIIGVTWAIAFASAISLLIGLPMMQSILQTKATVLAMAGKILSIIGLGYGVTWGLSLLLPFSFASSQLAAILLGPVLPLLAAAGLIRLGLAPLPSAIERKIPTKLRRFILPKAAQSNA